MSHIITNVMLELTRIFQEADLVDTPAEQVQRIVDEISLVTGADVCSLYMEDQNKDLVLLASHGLVTNHPIVIPAGRGLVGMVVRSRHTLNIGDPASHPDYYYVPQSDEERFHSFCGVPLVRRGKVMGVLVVQSFRSERLGNEQEAFLSTLASHLALLVPQIAMQNINEPKINVRYEGISGAVGIAIGKARLSHAESLLDVAEQKHQNADQEIRQWHALRTATVNDLSHEKEDIEEELGEEISGIFEAYKMLLLDPALGDRVELEIDHGYALLGALKRAIYHFSELFRNIEDPYLSARHEDIERLGDKIYQVWLRDFNQQQQNKTAQNNIDSPVILVGAHISVSDIASLPTDKLAGIVCFDGAALSHIAVFANALGIPAVMGIGEIKNLLDGEQLIVDGNSAQLIRNPSQVVLAEFEALINSRQHFDKQLKVLRDLPAITKDGTRIQLLANSGLQADVQPGIANGADGIGLYRTEIPFMVRHSLPSEDEQVLVYQGVFHAYTGKPVYIRTLDIGGDKLLPYLPVTEEENPALGWRGIRFTLDNVQLLMTQLRAIVRAAEGRDDIHILLPMVSASSELDRCIELLIDACQQLTVEGYRVSRPRIGVMIEVPAAISLLPFWRNKLDFISIGSNDLSQYLLAIDRNNPLVGKLYDPLHPAVIHELKRIVTSANEYKLALSLCGEMASDPVAVLLLAGLGIRRLSMSSTRLPLIKWIIRSLTIADMECFVEQALKFDNAVEIRKLGLEYLATFGIDMNNLQDSLSKSLAATSATIGTVSK